MKGDPIVIAHLNKVIKNELTAINQYFMHSRLLRHWGLERLGNYEYKESIDEMKHADALMERVLFLEGLPNLQDIGKLMIGESVKEVLECDLALEMKAHPDLKAAIADCERLGDYGSRDLFQRITVYDLKAKEASVRELADGRFETTIKLAATKYYADGQGEETEAPLNDSIEIGLFTERPGEGVFEAENVLFMERRPVRSGEQEVTIVTDKRPAWVGIDPYNKYVDRNSDDNIVAPG